MCVIDKDSEVRKMKEDFSTYSKCFPDIKTMESVSNCYKIFDSSLNVKKGRFTFSW